MGDDKKGKTGFNGFLSGFSEILDRLDTLSGDGGNGQGSFEFTRESGKKDGPKGVFGFSLKVGLGDDSPRVEPFGNIHKDKTTGRPVVREVREPMADLFEEAGYTLVVIEMPGIGLDDVHLDLDGDLLTIGAEKGDKKYLKEVLLPRESNREEMTLSCNNGILEIKCPHGERP